MKKIIQLVILGICINSFGQVGIGTQNPNATLDINGNLKIRVVPQETLMSSIKDSVLVTNGGYVKSVPSIELVKQALPTTVKGNFTSVSTVNISLASGSQIIPFDFEDFDTNDEFNTTTGIFTAKQDGIYMVNVQIKANSSLGIATNFGVQIVKNSTIEARNSFANVGVLGVNVTPPVRNSHTLLQLSTGDTLSFQLVGDAALGTVNLLGANEDSFFTIHQIR